MEKLDKHQSREFGPLALGTRAIAEIVEQLPGRSSLELIADDVKYESIEELGRLWKTQSIYGTMGS